MGTNPCLGRGDYVDLFTEASLLEPGCSDPTKGVRRARADFFDRVFRTKTFEFWSVVDGKRVQKRLTLEMFKRPDIFCGECGEKGNAYSVVESNTKTITVWCGVCKKAQTNLVSLFPLPTASALRDLGLDPHVREVANETEGETEKTFEFWSVVDGKRVQKRLTLEMFKRLDLMCGECGKGAGVHVVSGDKASVETTWCGHCQKVVTHMRSFFPLPTTSFLLELGLDPHVREVANRTEGETE